MRHMNTQLSATMRPASMLSRTPNDLFTQLGFNYIARPMRFEDIFRSPYTGYRVEYVLAAYIQYCHMVQEALTVRAFLHAVARALVTQMQHEAHRGTRRVLPEDISDEAIEALKPTILATQIPNQAAYLDLYQLIHESETELNAILDAQGFADYEKVMLKYSVAATRQMQQDVKDIDAAIDNNDIMQAARAFIDANDLDQQAAKTLLDDTEACVKEWQDVRDLHQYNDDKLMQKVLGERVTASATEAATPETALAQEARLKTSEFLRQVPPCVRECKRAINHELARDYLKVLFKRRGLKNQAVDAIAEQFVEHDKLLLKAHEAKGLRQFKYVFVSPLLADAEGKPKLKTVAERLKTEAQRVKLDIDKSLQMALSHVQLGQVQTYGRIAHVCNDVYVDDRVAAIDNLIHDKGKHHALMQLKGFIYNLQKALEKISDDIQPIASSESSIAAIYQLYQAIEDCKKMAEPKAAQAELTQAVQNVMQNMTALPQHEPIFRKHLEPLLKLAPHPSPAPSASPQAASVAKPAAGQSSLQDENQAGLRESYELRRR